jgi:hypothetical protein
METEPVRINKELLVELRKIAADKYMGRTYGMISATIEIAIRDYLDREKLHQEFKDKTQLQTLQELETKVIKLKSKIKKIYEISEEEE